MLKTLTQATAFIGLAVGATFVTPAERAEASGFSRSNCGGLNQKTCFHILPSKRCNAGLVEKKQGGRNICVRKSSGNDRTGDCGGLNQVTCISANPAKWCDDGLVEKRQPGRNICIKEADLTPGSDQCGGLNQQRCKHINPAKWCNEGLKNKIQWGKPDICIRRITNKDRLEVASGVIQELGSNNPLAELTQCLNRPGKIGEVKTAINGRSKNGVFSLISSCGTSLQELKSMGSMATLNNGTQAGNDKFFKTITITVGASGAAAVAGAAGAGIAIELQDDPNARWFFTGGIGAGPKAEVVGDITVGLSRSRLPTARWGFDHGTAAVVSGHFYVGLSGGVDFEQNSLNFSGISFGAGGGVGAGGAVYKTGALFPFRDF